MLDEALNFLYNILGKENEAGSFNYIYPMTTENLKGYYKFINNCSRVLCVTASGDHMLNLIVNGAREITMFDANPIAYYFVKLKMTALRLSRNSFIDFFTVKDWKTYSPAFFNEETYSYISTHLEDDVREFWDSYYKWLNDNDCTPQESELFRHIRYSQETLIDVNPYLDAAVYDEMYKLVNTVKLTFIDKDVVTLFEEMPETEKYNTILLSNLSDYIKNIFGVDKIKSMFNLPEDADDRTLNAALLKHYGKFVAEIAEKHLTYDGQIFFAYIYELTTSPKWTAIDDFKLVCENINLFETKTFPAICRSYKNDNSKIDCVLIRKNKKII